MQKRGNMKQQNKRKDLRVFALASFLNDLGSDIIYPIWPLFVTTILHANMAVLGLLDGIGEAIVSLSKAASGYISDRIQKRKVFIWTGYLCGALSRIGYALAASWQVLIPFRILDRAGKIRSAPRDAIIADISTQEDRGRNFGLLRTMDNLGAVCGILVCIFFFHILGYRLIFMLAAIPSTIGTLLIIAFIKERKKPDRKIFKPLSLRHLDKNLKLFLVLNGLFALGSFTYSFLLVYAGKFGFKLAFVPVLYLVFTAVASLSSLPFGKLADKIGRKPVLFLSFLFWLLVGLAIIFLKSKPAIVFAFILYGLHRGALEPAQKTLASELAPVEYRASILGGLQMVVGLCAFPASLIAGLLWEKAGLYAPFYLSAGLTIAAVILLFFIKEGPAVPAIGDPGHQ